MRRPKRCGALGVLRVLGELRGLGEPGQLGETLAVEAPEEGTVALCGCEGGEVLGMVGVGGGDVGGGLFDLGEDLVFVDCHEANWTNWTNWTNKTNWTNLANTYWIVKEPGISVGVVDSEGAGVGADGLGGEGHHVEGVADGGAFEVVGGGVGGVSYADSVGGVDENRCLEVELAYTGFGDGESLECVDGE